MSLTPLPLTAAHAASSQADVTSRQDATSASLAARLEGHRVEVLNDRTGSSTTWANPDGSFTTDQTTGPTRVQEPDGSWVPLDMNLQPDGQGGYAPVAVPNPLTFSGGGDKTAIDMGEGKDRSLNVDWSAKLPTPTVTGGTASYQVDSNTQLRLSTTALGANAHIVLAAAPTSQPTYRFPLDPTRVNVAQSHGGVAVTDASSGKLLAYAHRFTMWDAQTDQGGDPTNVVPVSESLTTDSAGNPQLVLTPSLSFLTAPTTQYPVTIDPNIGSLGHNSDTYVDSAFPTTEYWSSYATKVGSPDGTRKYRAMLSFNTGQIYGAHVTTATLTLHQYYSATCTTKQTNIFPMTSSDAGTGGTWNGQPGINSAYEDTATFNHGFGTGCPVANQNLDVTNIVNAWSEGAITNYGFELRENSETDSLGEKRFCSMNPESSGTCSQASSEPNLSVTYNFFPQIAKWLWASTHVINTAGKIAISTVTPTLNATTDDADGSPTYTLFQVLHDPAYPGEGTGVVWAAYTPTTFPQGSRSSLAVPSGYLINGDHYEWEAIGLVQNGNGGDDYAAAWSPMQYFIVDTTKPATPTVTCTYSSGVWTNRSPSGDSCTATDTTDSDLGGFDYDFDNPDPETKAPASMSSATISIPNSMANGWHTLYVQSYDIDQNRSTAIKQYSFGVGVGGLTSPSDGDTTQQAVVLTTAATSAETGVTFNYRIGNTGSWVTVPTADVTIPGSGSHPTWPQTLSGGVSSPLDWNLAQTVGNAGGSDGPVQLQACFSHSGMQDGCSTTETLSLDRTAFGASQSTASFGPGTLSLLTGDLDVSATDVNIASSGDNLTLGRDLTTLGPTGTDTGATGIFGPAWTAALPGPSDGFSAETLATDPAIGFATLTDSTGVTSIYMTTNTGYPYTFTGLGDADDGSVLTQTSSTAANMYEPDTATTTAWTLSGSTWRVQSVTEAGANNATTYSYNSAGQVTQVLAPVPAGVTCSSPLTTRGCRTLTLTYATASDPNLATGTSQAQWGDYWDATNSVGRLASVSLTAYDAATMGMHTVAVADYAYDNTGLLRGEWDPRISPTLETTYSYTAANRLSTLTPPGLNGDTINYDSAGRVASVQWTDPANGTATQTVAYTIPITGSGAPIDMSSAATDTWGQTNDLPYTATEVFTPDHVPATGSGGDYAPTSSDLPYGSITYLDVNGKDVDDASYGAGAWQVAATQYDSDGNTIWQLGAANRDQALSPTADTDPLVASMPTSAQRADALADTAVYASNGYDLTDTYGPMHPVTLGNGSLAGSVVDAQDHSHYVYNQGAPSGGSYDLVTETDESPYFPQNGSSTPTDYTSDTRTTLTGYNPIDGSSNTGPTSGWTLSSPTTSTTVMPGGGTNNITSETQYDSDGNVIQTRMPKANSSGTDAETTNITFYTAASNSTYPECGGHAEWADQVCRTAPAAQPTSGPPVPVTETTYNVYEQPLTVVDTSGTITRTTTYTYDGAARELTKAINDTTTGVPNIPTTTSSYAPSTGLPTGASSTAGTITIGYDALGRVTSYQAPTASGTNTATTSYDIDGRPLTINDGKGTTTYGYDGTDSLGNTEHRGLLTSESTGVSTDTFTGAYDGDGNLISQTYPNGLVATTHYDNVDSPTDLNYAMGSTVWADFQDAYNNFAQVITQSSPESSQAISYDQAGRISQVADAGDSTCLTRTYGYDLDSNRSSDASYPADSTGACSTSTTPTSETYSHDQADRLSNTGYSYDNLGRTTSVPAVDTYDTNTSPTALSLTYNADDMVHTMTQDGDTKTFTLDPAERILGETDSSTGITETTIYADSSDSPAWISTSTGGWSRNITDLRGNLAATETAADDAHTTLQLTNIHGDVVATAPDSGGDVGYNTYSEATEFGTPRASDTPAARYGWLGGKQRSSDALAGAVLMGERIYLPTVGRYLSCDPVPGGSANKYDYVGQDPINAYDLNGQMYLAGNGPAPRHHKRVVWSAPAPSRSSRSGHRGGGGKSRSKKSGLFHFPPTRGDVQDAAVGGIVAGSVGVALFFCLPECAPGELAVAALEEDYGVGGIAALFSGLGTVASHYGRQAGHSIWSFLNHHRSW